MTHKKKEPLIIVLSAPSGSGKTTLVRELIRQMEGVERSVSYTTRQPRQGEKDGEDYIFIPEEEFERLKDRGDFLEHEENFGHKYGTSKKQIKDILEKGSDVVLSIDVKGARTVKKEFPQSISVFVMPPSMEELEARLRGRNTDREQQVELRLRESRQEVAAADEYDFLLVNNKLDQAVRELMQVIEEERKNRKKISQEAGK
jgi:guanylate kinase